MNDPDTNARDEALPEATSSLSSPLGLRRYLRRPEVGFNLLPFLDFVVIVLLFALLSSSIVFSPGVTFDLPQRQGSQLEGVPVTGVLTLRPNMILFDGARRNLANLKPALVNYLQEQGRAEEDIVPTTLLVKLDRDVSMSQFLEISEIARAAGFDRIQVAASAPKGELPERLPGMN